MTNNMLHFDNNYRAVAISLFVTSLKVLQSDWLNEVLRYRDLTWQLKGPKRLFLSLDTQLRYVIFCFPNMII